jgi:M6 family metalloprotease-like protein
MKQILVFGVIFFAFFNAVDAAVAYPYPVKIKQKDGSSLNVRIHGDEWYHWTTTTDGYRIVQNENGLYEYAAMLKSGSVVASGIRANNVGKRIALENEFIKSLSAHLGVSSDAIQQVRQKRFPNNSLLKSTTSSVNFQRTGNRKLLVILANFSNTTPSNTVAQFDKMMNEQDYNSTGSFKDYYLENSNGLLSIQSTVTQWVTLPNTREYYAPDSKWTEFAFDAISAAAQAGVDLSLFDNDADGKVESIAIFHTGAGQEITSDVNDIWSHSYKMSYGGYTVAQRTFNNVVVDNYTVQGERMSAISNQITTIGVLTHEFGHALGAPDYYDVDLAANGSYEGTGQWDVMSGGLYNTVIEGEDGNSPAHHNPFTKAEFGWITVNPLSVVSKVTAAPVLLSHSAYRINTTTDNEYFLLENRVQQGFDSALPGEGLIIYHVDGTYIAEHRVNNSVNTTSHQGLYVKVASGFINSSTCPFPGTAGVVAFTDFTDPSALSWSGAYTSKSVTGVYTDANANVVFDFMALQDGAPTDFNASAGDYQTVNVSWKRSVENYPVLIAVNTLNAFGTPVNGQNYTAGDALTGGGTIVYAGADALSFVHTPLNEATRYYYRIWSDRGATYSAVIDANVLTPAQPVTSYPWTEGFESDLNKWIPIHVSGINKWTINEADANSVPSNAFSGNKNALIYNEGDFTMTKLVSPVFVASAGEKFRLSFQHAQANWEGDQDSLRVYYKLASSLTWIELADYDADIPLWREQMIDFNPGGDFQIAFEGRTYWGFGVAIDDVAVAKYVVTPPVILPALFTVNSSTSSSLTVAWQKGSGNASLVVCREGGDVLGLPNDGDVYAPSSEFGSGSQLNPFDYVVYSGAGNEMTVSGLITETLYSFAIFTFDDATNTYQPVALTGQGTTLVDNSTILNVNKTVEGWPSIWPNPSSGDFNISFGEDVSMGVYQVFTANGQLLLQKEFKENKVIVGLAGYPSGIYTLVIQSDNTRITKRLIKK